MIYFYENIIKYYNILENIKKYQKILISNINIY